MQGINPPTPAQLLAAGQEPYLKFEIYVAPAWIDLCALAGKNYVEFISISLGGASMTPNPIGGKCSVMLANEGAIFHPDHPTSGYDGYCITSRKVRISVGATYAGVGRIWQRLIGYMDEPKFSAPDYRVNISGGDYMKMLENAQFQELDATYPNHWGSSQTYDSIPSDGLMGTEIYNTGAAPTDAMDIDDDPASIGNWVAVGCNFTWLADGSGPSTNVGRMTAPVAGCHVKNVNVGAATAGNQYKFKFQYRGVGGVGATDTRIEIRQTAGLCKSMIYPTFDAWIEDTFYFTALDNTAIQIWIYGHVGMADFQLDLFSIFEYVPEINRYYQLPGASKGPYHVTLGGVIVEQGEEDEGWYYEEATGRVFFDRNKTVPDGTGTNNITIYYFTLTALEDAVARILWFAQVPDPATGVPYVNEAAAKAAIVGAPEYVDPNVDIDKVWFNAGTTLLNAIRMICERCDYRFYFKHDGTPVFRPKPTAGAAVFTFTNPSQIASIRTYQSHSEIKNRIIIKGIKQAEPINREETTPSELKGEANDAASIAAYGERTLTIRNYLFQTQAPLDAMAITLRNEYKDPKWYCDLVIPFNPVPLELGDNIQWEERFSPVLDVTQTGIIRDIKITNFTTTYKVVKT